MKKVLFTLFALFSLLGNAKAQIALTYDDTLICRGATISMGADVTGQTSTLSVDDDFTSAVNIGFPFVFYGNTYTQVAISDNNYISFNLAYAGATFSSYTWPQATGNVYNHADNVIMAALMDLYLPAGGRIQTQSFGTPGRRMFIVEWCNVPKYGCNSYTVTNQIILYEGTNVIEIHTTNIPPQAGTTPCPTTNGGTNGNGIQGLRWINGTTINEIYPTGRGPADYWGVTGASQTSIRFTPTANAPFYTIDSIPYNPWHIIQSVNNNLLQWYDANGNPLGTGTTLTTTVSNPPSPAPSTFYVVEYTGAAGCGNTQTFTFRDTILVRFSDIKTYINDEMCAGSTYNFHGRTLFTPGVYDTTFLSQIGCDSTIILTLGVNPLPNAQITNVDKKAKICAGDRFVFAAPKVNGYQYQWYKDSNPLPGATLDTFGATLAGNYSVEVTSNKGCKKLSDPVELVIAPIPTVKINNVSSNDVCALDTVTLNAMAVGNNLEYIWTPSEYFLRTQTNSKSSNVKGIISKSGYVYVKVINNDLCSSTDSVFIKAEPCCDMTVPNAFTPNGDGKNDRFIPLLEVSQQIVNFVVYNRYGQLVYESNNSLAQGWDGKDKNGKDLQAGVYMYALKYSCTDGKIYEKKGDVTLIR